LKAVRKIRKNKRRLAQKQREMKKVIRKEKRMWEKTIYRKNGGSI